MFRGFANGFFSHWIWELPAARAPQAANRRLSPDQTTSGHMKRIGLLAHVSGQEEQHERRKTRIRITSPSWPLKAVALNLQSLAEFPKSSKKAGLNNYDEKIIGFVRRQ